MNIGLNDLREMYLKFFETKGHLRLPSSSLIPESDPSLLLINSGMAPLKSYFTGNITPPSKRITTCQKCIRTPDIERVGKTSRHGTFFEMLGNFSFGDYFKKEAILWAWEFVTEVVKLPKDRLWVTVYLEDDEAENIWVEQANVPRDRIVRLGKEDNFWEHGTGPCGPCSEIYYDRGEAAGCGAADCKVGCDCDRYVEFWNLVFTQFDRDEAGNYNRLSHPNIDTGMGLERLAAIVQGVDNLFEVDTISDILENVASLAGIVYKNDEKKDVSLRVITDHIRSTVFMISDGVVPSNEGRGYVLRRLIRRAARHGLLLGIVEPFLHDIAKIVIKHNISAYPELEGKVDYISKIIKLEENRFSQTIEQGIEFLREYTDGLATESIFPGELAFKLYDTYGFPLDLTQEILSEKSVTVDENAFNKLMQKQRQRARDARRNISSWSGNNDEAPTDSPDEASDAHVRAHSATHLLQAALRGELGEHVTQKGSFVGEDKLRFDFSHFEPLSPESLARVEQTVNKNILRAMPSKISQMSLKEAEKIGAMALFNEKYGEVVRVVELGDASVELCSGRHVENTGNIGIFHINSETGSAAGIRRIDASVGLEILRTIASLNDKFDEYSAKTRAEIKELKQEVKNLKSASHEGGSMAKTQEISGIIVSALTLPSSDIDVLKGAADNLKNQSQSDVIAIGGADDNGIKFVVSATQGAVDKGIHAGNIIREISAVVGGRGGGKPHFAQAGGKDAAKLEQAIEKVFNVVSSMIPQ
ncbi:MAG: alanine--tRNA ligase [Clostridiales bacterium]|jgi:alanyl-tRNA synthetase|nr:alanine--tRNA ligase [Clostridiales bacterium]